MSIDKERIIEVLRFYVDKKRIPAYIRLFTATLRMAFSVMLFTMAVVVHAFFVLLKIVGFINHVSHKLPKLDPLGIEEMSKMKMELSFNLMKKG